MGHLEIVSPQILSGPLEISEPHLIGKATCKLVSHHLISELFEY